MMILGDSSDLMEVRQARVDIPFMTRAQEPHTASRQLYRKARVGSCWSRMSLSASSTVSAGPGSCRNSWK